MTKDDLETVLGKLSVTFGDRLTVSSTIRQQHGQGEGYKECHPPDAVVFPKTNQEVSEILQLCYRHNLPVIPFGAGTSLEGHVAALTGGVCIDLSEMCKILEVNQEDLDCRVQTGVTRKALNSELRHTGLFFPVDPGADATLGGMVATRASGTNAVRYGTMRDVVLGLTVVTPEGKIIKTGGRARKSSTGYDLTRLFTGSEGTLGIITEVRLRIFGRPEQMSSAVCQFPDLKSAVNSVILAMQMGLPLARIELLDEIQMGACIAYSKLQDLAPLPTLFLEFHGSEATVKDNVQQMLSVTNDFGGSSYKWATLEEDRAKLWKARHDAFYAGLALKPGFEAFVTDACVPISRLVDCILATREAADKSGLVCPIVGHVGDGNFHSLILYDPKDNKQRDKAEKLTTHISRLALQYGGTCSGEHGIGIHKLHMMREEHGEAIALMQTIKKALDPKNIMNPGKTIPNS